LPIGSSAPKNILAALSLISATFGPSGRSVDANGRPRTNGTRMSENQFGVTTSTPVTFAKRFSGTGTSLRTSDDRLQVGATARSYRARRPRRRDGTNAIQDQ
jgi:hypothetical protein